MRRCRTQLRCRTLRCTLRFAKSISLASLLGESLLLRQHLKPYCLVGFRVSVKEILCGVAARNCVAELFVARSALRNLFRSLRCWANLFFSANTETLLNSRVSCYFKVELSYAVQQPSKHLLGTAV